MQSSHVVRVVADASVLKGPLGSVVAFTQFSPKLGPMSSVMTDEACCTLSSSGRSGIAHVFTQDPTVIRAVERNVLGAALSLPGYAFLMSMAGPCRGASDSLRFFRPLPCTPSARRAMNSEFPPAFDAFVFSTPSFFPIISRPRVLCLRRFDHSGGFWA
jgi:hypothetical protein